MLNVDDLTRVADRVDPNWRGRSRNPTTVMVRTLLSRKLSEQGYPLKKVGAIVGINHPAVIYNLKKDLTPKYLPTDQAEVFDRWNEEEAKAEREKLPNDERIKALCQELMELVETDKIIITKNEEGDIICQLPTG